MSRHTLTGRQLSPRTYRAAQAGLALVAAASAFLSVLTASVGWLGLIGVELVGWTLWPGWRVTLTCSDPGCLQCAKCLVCANWHRKRRAQEQPPDEGTTGDLTLRGTT